MGSHRLQQRTNTLIRAHSFSTLYENKHQYNDTSKGVYKMLQGKTHESYIRDETEVPVMPVIW